MSSSADAGSSGMERSLDPHAVMLSRHPRVDAPDVAGAFPAVLGCRHKAHTWQRTVSRRRMIQTAAGAAGLAVGGTLWRPRQARAAQMNGVMPRPIPGGLDLGDGRVIHIYNDESGQEPSTITDFRGFVGVSHARGEGTVTQGGEAGGLPAPAATGDRLVYNANMRFMQGHYIGVDGEEHDGTAAFI
jgi:hypothetical protein